MRPWWWTMRSEDSGPSQSVRPADDFVPVPGCTDEVLAARRGVLGRILLNRPRTINSLTHAMVLAVRHQLEDWSGDESIHSVCISGAGDRGLCAGGDIRAIQAAILSDKPAAAVDFWADEYRMNAAIADFAKPLIAIMDGVVMGGGVGISAFGSLRLVTERSRIAMPETIIGYFPDVGSLYLLSRTPGELGTHVALTGSTITGTDAIAIGLADAMIPATAIDPLLERLAAGEPLDMTVGETGPESRLAADRGWIDDCYAGDDPQLIMERLLTHQDPVAREAGELLGTRSPLSVAVTLEAIRRAARMDTLQQVLDQDLRLGTHFTAASDLIEGVRARLVDKDNQPHWRHPSLAAVDRDEVLSFFDET